MTNRIKNRKSYVGSSSCCNGNKHNITARKKQLKVTSGHYEFFKHYFTLSASELDIWGDGRKEVYVFHHVVDFPELVHTVRNILCILWESWTSCPSSRVVLVFLNSEHNPNLDLGEHKLQGHRTQQLHHSSTGLALLAQGHVEGLPEAGRRHNRVVLLVEMGTETGHGH